MPEGNWLSGLPAFCIAGEAGRRAQFCPESNDLLYPKEDRERRVLIFQCQNCDYKEDADPADWCVYRCGRKPCRPLLSLR